MDDAAAFEGLERDRCGVALQQLMKIFNTSLAMVLDFDDAKTRVQEGVRGFLLRGGAWWGQPPCGGLRSGPFPVVIEREIDGAGSQLLHAGHELVDIVDAIEGAEGRPVLEQLIAREAVENAFGHQNAAGRPADDPQGFLPERALGVVFVEALVLERAAFDAGHKTRLRRRHGNADVGDTGAIAMHAEREIDQPESLRKRDLSLEKILLEAELVFGGHRGPGAVIEPSNRSPRVRASWIVQRG